MNCNPSQSLTYQLACSLRRGIRNEQRLDGIRREGDITVQVTPFIYFIFPPSHLNVLSRKTGPQMEPEPLKVKVTRQWHEAKSYLLKLMASISDVHLQSAFTRALALYGINPAGIKKINKIKNWGGKCADTPK